MTKEQALNVFWNSFQIPAYDENTVKPDTGFPRITYQTSTDSFEGSVTLTASVWYKSTSWTAVSQKVAEIAKAIAEHGYYINQIDGGYMWITKGSPFAQRLSDEDDSVRRIYLTINVEFLTAY